MTRNFLLAAVLGLGTALTATNAVYAQSNVYGYYYPDTNYWSGERHRYDSYGMPSFLESRYTKTSPAAPVYQTPAATPVVPRAKRARICLEVPDAKARVWFENHATTSTGTSRVFETPAIEAGAVFNYHLKVAWKESGQDFSLQRDVAVSAGQTLTVDFAEAAALMRKSRSATVAHGDK